MPLIKSKSEKAFKKNIATEVKAGNQSNRLWTNKSHVKKVCQQQHFACKYQAKSIEI
jgi:hypothetical protein